MLDKEAEERGTTVYLVNKRVDMLPKLLGESILAPTAPVLFHQICVL